MPEKYMFLIPIGDWSDDGHGKCDWFQFESNKPLQDVREAYFKAMKKHKEASPEDFCNEYEEMEPHEEAVEAAKALGYTIDVEDFGPENMADYVAWFITLGDPDIKLTRQEDLDMLPFYGYDEKNRHVGGFGYGLFCC